MELLAVITFVQHFTPYLLGREFQFHTDHGSLAWLTNFKAPEGQLARWLVQLQEFKFNIIHRPGKNHTNADALSRHPCSQFGRPNHSHHQVSPESDADMTAAPVLSERSPQEISRLQLEDGPIYLLIEAIGCGAKPSFEDVRREGPEAQRLLQLWERLSINKGVLKRKYDDVRRNWSWLQLVVPHSLKS